MSRRTAGILRDMKISATPLTAALAGLFSGFVMPMLWSRYSDGGVPLVLSFLLVVAVPAHVFVLGLHREPQPERNKLDTAMLKRVGAWLAAAAVPLVFTEWLAA